MAIPTQDASTLGAASTPEDSSGYEVAGVDRPHSSVSEKADHVVTRLSAAWAAITLAVVLGIALVVFVVQNTRSVKVQFFGASGHIPVAVALLAAALIGAFVVLVIGTMRTTQIRIAARRELKRRTAREPGEKP